MPNGWLGSIILDKSSTTTEIVLSDIQFGAGVCMAACQFDAVSALGAYIFSRKIYAPIKWITLRCESIGRDAVTAKIFSGGNPDLLLAS